MTMQAHLAELEKRHETLESEIHRALMHPSVDDLAVVALKRKKLRLKEEIARLRESGTLQ